MTLSPRIVGLLILSSLLNAAIGVLSFFFGVFATSPEMQDVAMRLGYYVVNAIVLAALVGVFAPWVLALRNLQKSALVLAILPSSLVCLAVLAFLTLDSWLQRTFSG